MNWQVRSAVVFLCWTAFGVTSYVLETNSEEVWLRWRMFQLPSWLSHSRGPEASHKFRSQSNRTTKDTCVVPWWAMGTLQISASSQGGGSLGTTGRLKMRLGFVFIYWWFYLSIIQFTVKSRSAAVIISIIDQSADYSVNWLFCL